MRAGEWDTKTAWEEFPTQDRGVQRIIIHEEYYAAGLRNDIALLLLDSPFNLTKVVSTVCLPEKEEDMDVTNCVVTGWGKDAFGKYSYNEFLNIANKTYSSIGEMKLIGTRS